MHLQEVRVKNFRNLRDVTARFRPGLNALVGRNSTGKTNLLFAIRQALHSAFAAESLWLSEDDIYRAPKGPRTETTIRIDLTFAQLNEKQRAQFFELLVIDPADAAKSPAELHFEATWNDNKKRFSFRRWGGPNEGDKGHVPQEVLDALPVTFLPALRNAEEALMPGSRSRLARVLEHFSTRLGREDIRAIEDIFKTANDALSGQKLITDLEKKVRQGTQAMAGNDYVASSIRAGDLELSQILRTLKVRMDDNPVPHLGFAGLGYNNLLFIATILAQLQEARPEESPILLVEEPEAHLHPQLTVLLGNYLRDTLKAGTTPQALVSTHSPTFAAHIRPSQVCMVLKTDLDDVCFRPLADANLDESEERQLQRMLDITRATLYFAKGLILVEGISEALLIPELAKLKGIDLAKAHVSVIPICGVSFQTFLKLLGPDMLSVPTAIVSDADPNVERDPGGGWEHDRPTSEISDRAKRLQTIFADKVNVLVCLSEVTLEYDLAKAGDGNAAAMVKVWESQFPSGSPKTLSASRLQSLNTNEERALCVWRGICRANPTIGKADFAHALTEWLEQKRQMPFEVPEYIGKAIAHVWPKA